MHLHRLANGILSLYVWLGSTAYSEMLSHHTEIIVPSFVVAHRFAIQLLESKSCDTIRKFMFGENFSRHLHRIVLIFDHANYHALQDLVGLARMRMRFG